MSDELRDTTPAKLLAAHQRRFDPRASFYEVSCNCGEWTAETINSHKTALQLHAEHQLAALKASGWAVVKLPEPSYQDDPDENGIVGIGFNGTPADRRLATERGVYVHRGRVFDQWDGVSPDEARKVASWWLAAANAADTADGA